MVKELQALKRKSISKLNEELSKTYLQTKHLGIESDSTNGLFPETARSFAKIQHVALLLMRYLQTSWNFISKTSLSYLFQKRLVVYSTFGEEKKQNQTVVF